MNPHSAPRARLAAPALCAVSAVHAAVTAAVTALEPHRVWGLCAAPAYAALALVLLLAARRPGSTGVVRSPPTASPRQPASATPAPTAAASASGDPGASGAAAPARDASPAGDVASAGGAAPVRGVASAGGAAPVRGVAWARDVARVRDVAPAGDAALAAPIDPPRSSVRTRLTVRSGLTVRPRLSMWRSQSVHRRLSVRRRLPGRRWPSVRRRLPVRRWPSERRSRPERRWLPFPAFAVAAVVPLLLLVGAGSAQEEVGVVHRSAARLVAHGTPYLAPEALAGADYTAYNPYFPGMALLGLPHRFLGLDARFVFGAVFLLAFALSLRTAGLRGARGRTMALAASPLVALPLATGGDDLPVVGLVCLGLALAGEDEPRAARAGLVLAAACTLKATAWPALAVAVALLHVRGGRPAVLRCAGAAAPLLVAGLALPALADPTGLAVNAVGYPLGLADAASPAATPLPGRLLGRLGPGGHALAVALLVLAAALVLRSLYSHPPRDARAAALRLALGLLTAMALMPASRFGYAVYPLVLALWAHWRKSDAPPHAVTPTVIHASSPPAGGGVRAHPRGDQRLPAPPGRHRKVRARDRSPLPAR
ncbi:hypothetical protein [Streptomyces reniochalinae]|uniref:hypothetical protein n=1 Tax=Streptomyces reniochalinae TaxID=2250578 RepID=UPI001FE56A04|nr:hypothetical protein [Streptomyces reniochalinae]